MKMTINEIKEKLKWITDSEDEFLNGYYVPYQSSVPTKVIIWRGPRNDNVHCTTNLNKNEWETAKS